MMLVLASTPEVETAGSGRFDDIGARLASEVDTAGSVRC
jgi:hypothetical protein